MGGHRWLCSGFHYRPDECAALTGKTSLLRGCVVDVTRPLICVGGHNVLSSQRCCSYAASSTGRGRPRQSVRLSRSLSVRFRLFWRLARECAARAPHTLPRSCSRGSVLFRRRSSHPCLLLLSLVMASWSPVWHRRSDTGRRESKRVM